MPIPKLPLQLTRLLYPYHRAWWRKTLRRRSILTDWNKRNKAIFVHIPKTAGTSILAALGAEEVFDTHAPAESWRDVYPSFFNGAHKFAFVRNPWDRFASVFHFMKQGTDWPMQQEWARRHIGDLDFATFTHRLKNPLFRANVMAERFFWPQHFWLGGAYRPLLVDELYRFEDIDAAVALLCKRFGMIAPERAPHLRKVEKPDFRSLYDAEMVAIVGKLYRADIELLDYRFAP